LRGVAGPFIRGGKWFRPVAMVAAPDGGIYLTDWVLKDYPNHGQGRIWKLTARPGVAVMTPPVPFEAPEIDAGSARIEGLMRMRPREVEELRAALHDRDPFIRHAAIVALARPELQSALIRELESSDPALRLGAVQALRMSDVPEPEKLIPPLLRDGDKEVRLMALVWTGEKELRALRPAVEKALARADVTPELFETWLATMQILDTPAPPRLETVGYLPSTTGFRKSFPVTRQRSPGSAAEISISSSIHMATSITPTATRYSARKASELLRIRMRAIW
jgi:hypothetical protein